MADHWAVLDEYLAGGELVPYAAPEHVVGEPVTVEGHAREVPPEQPQAQTIRVEAPPPQKSAPVFVQNVSRFGNRAADKVSAAPTPGGIGFLVMALLFFIFVIVPVNGKATRLKLIWLSLTGGATMPTDGGGSSSSAPGDAVDTAAGAAGAVVGGAVGIDPGSIGGILDGIGAGIGAGIGLGGGAIPGAAPRMLPGSISTW